MKNLKPSDIGIGAHVSIAGGYDQALERAREDGLDAIQFFTSSPRSRMRRVVSKKESDDFVEMFAASPVRNIYIHTPYYINAASPDSRIWHFSQSYILREIELMDRINSKFFVMHLGSHRGAGKKTGIERVVRMVQEVLKKTPKSHVNICLENTAGQKNEVGSDLDDLSLITKKFSNNKRVMVIIDTCHLFAAGYDLRNKSAVEATFKEIGKKIGWQRIPMFHFNDSKVEIGGNRDRHEHLGKGCIGVEGFRAILGSSKLKGKDLILETESDGRPADLTFMRSILKR